jgi:hypothetical protein
VKASAIGRLRIIVLGHIVRCPLGGLAWHYLQYILGLARLGHDVYFVEDSDDYYWSCYDPVKSINAPEPTYGLEFAARTFERVGLGDRWAYYDAHTSRWLGPCANQIHGACTSADLVFNVSGVNPLRPWLMEIPVRVLIDTDPAFTQVKHLTEPMSRNRALCHTVFFSFGENIALSRASLPSDGFPWKPTRQPIVMDIWPLTSGPRQGIFTTVMSWESYQVREYGGVRYGMKSDSFDPYMDLPGRAGPIFELAVSGSPTTRSLLASKGWLARNPLAGPAQDPWAYQRYIKQSKAEFSIAKHGYVVSRSGWFSDRSAAYLASGRPVLVQETGFSDWMQTGAGVIPFSTPEDVVAGVEEINNHYELHCRTAREIAEEYFDALKVLPRLIEYAINSPSATYDPQRTI